MDKKQLNLNAPLLSMRKTASNFLGASNKQNKKKLENSGPLRQRSLPPNQPEWELSEVSKPGTIPFLWEQMPGRPKEDVSGETESQKLSSSTPRLPPGWGADGSRRNSGERPVVGYNTHKSSFEACHLTDHAALIESLRASMYDNGRHDLEDENDAYSCNAADTLSLEDSMSINCSVSGVSNLDVSSKNQSSNIEKQTKELMMSRFLPAAKAVALETPQYVPKNKHAVPEQPKQVKKAIHVERNPLLENKSRSNIILSEYEYAEDATTRDAASEDDNNKRERSKRSGKAWGFLPRIVPRLCVKKTLSMLNPVPGLKTKSLTPRSPANDISRLTRKAYSGPLDKPTLDPNNKKKFHSGALSGELRRMGETNQFSSYSNASYKPGGLSPFRTARSAGVSPYRNATPLSPFDKGARFLAKPKDIESPLSATSSPFLRKKELVSAEKVVRVDSEYLKSVKSSNLEKFSESPTDINKKEIIAADNKSLVLDDALFSSVDCVSKLVERMEDEQLDEGTNNASSAIPRSPLPPPLPKSPSESWLWKTVPSIPFRNPFSYSNNANTFHSNKAAGEKSSALGVKWETIVKTSNLHHTHSRYSEELLPHLSH